MENAARGKLGILVGGGPAPGINAVIGAATIRAALSGTSVLGILDGFEHMMKPAGSFEMRRAIRPLGIDDVSRIHFRGGSAIGTSRANPTRSREQIAHVVENLQALGVEMLVTIGGDDTCFSASKIAEASAGAIRVAHVPKTIDNDLDLPLHTDTFGFQTARHLGVELVENLMVDARTTKRWYFAIAMGRKAGHLALGIGKAAGATLTLIPEEWPEGPIPFDAIVDNLVCAIAKRIAAGRPDGVAVLAEGLVERMGEHDLAALEGVERDAHGHIRISEIPFGDLLKTRVSRRLAEHGIKTTIVSKDIGYELRCADPVPFDMEYARDLGYCAAKFVGEGGSNAMVAMIQGRFEAIPFDRIMDRATGRIRVRMVDVKSDRYMIARRYMLRLRDDDFADAALLGKLAATLHMSALEFEQRFRYLCQHEPMPRSFVAEGDTRPSVRP
jgi:ATP-dependent phosphofructokinase / diphosphate-dependent phosphofructokinase